ncbi:MAG TPA: hypothetical protein VKV39_14225 [Candidatus Sulfotelmatobacter sp.]|nr:hypothetical protein [Candidatus Sulfotelmatobacter sp.]
MPAAPPRKLDDLIKPAESALAHFLQHDAFQSEQLFMRLTADAAPGPWSPLTPDTATNDRLIKEAIERSPRPVTELAVAFAGMIDFRGGKRLMGYLQFYRAGYAQGLLCLRHLKPAARPGMLEGFGGFLTVGSCKNIWL